jgi:hypothetical protein
LALAFTLLPARLAKIPPNNSAAEINIPPQTLKYILPMVLAGPFEVVRTTIKLQKLQKINKNRKNIRKLYILNEKK